MLNGGRLSALSSRPAACIAVLVQASNLKQLHKQLAKEVPFFVKADTVFSANAGLRHGRFAHCLFNHLLT